MATPSKSNFLRRQFPTLLGVVFLAVALVIGLVVFQSGGLGGFAPRAAPETTPKKITITNVSDTSFSVSFVTDSPTSSFLKYGSTAAEQNTQVQDDRAQRTGQPNNSTTHHITVRNLSAGSTYYFVLGTGNGAEFDNNGQAFSVQTAAQPISPGGTSLSISGDVTSSTQPLAEAIVYVLSDEMAPLSTLTNQQGRWAIDLGQARNANTLQAVQVSNGAYLTLIAQGTSTTQSQQTAFTLQTGSPAPTIDVVSGPNVTAPTPSSGSNTQQTATNSQTTQSEQTDTTFDSGNQSSFAADTTPDPVELDLSNLSPLDIPVVTTATPVIKGQAAPLTRVRIEVNSDNQVIQEVISDPQGNFELDLSEFSDGLEPGNHTVQYSYTDPDTGELISQTHSFTVDTSSLIAQADTGGSAPFSTSNPFPVTSPSPTSTPLTSSPLASPGGTITNPSTDSAIPVSGSVDATLGVLVLGMFLIGAGSWSYYLSAKLDTPNHAE